MNRKPVEGPSKPPQTPPGRIKQFFKFFDNFLPKTPFSRDRTRMRLGLLYAFFAWNALGAIVVYHVRSGGKNEELKKLHFASKDDLSDSPG